MADVAEIATAIGVFFALFALAAQLRGRKHSLAQAYLSRYWYLLDLMREDVDEVELLRRKSLYLEFCEDQYDMARLGWVDSSTWVVWHAGIGGGLLDGGLDSYAGKSSLVHLTDCLTHGVEVARRNGPFPRRLDLPRAGCRELALASVVVARPAVVRDTDALILQP